MHIAAQWLRLKQWSAAPFRHRSLFKGFLRQDISGRFAGSMGGIFWSVLTPLANIIMYVFVFSVIMKIRVAYDETGTDRFVLYLLGGMLPWLAFSEALGRAPTILLEKSSLITKVSFPVEILPHVGTATPFLLNGIGFGLFLLYLIFLGYAHPAWLYLPLVLVFHLLFTLGLVAMLSALGVFVRDIQHVIGLLVSIWFFMTPIIYPLSMVPEELRLLMQINPMYPFIDLYRQVLLQHQLSLPLLAAAAILGVLSYSIGGWFFMRIKHAFGDVL